MNILFPPASKDDDARRVAREIDRARRHAANDRIALNNELSKLDAQAKLLAKAGRNDELMIVATQISSLRRQRTELTRADAQQQRIKNVVQANAMRDRNMDALRRGTAHLQASNARCPPDVARKIATDYQAAMFKSNHIASVLEDSLVEDDDDDVEDGQDDTVTSIAEQYISAASIQLASTMPTMPTHQAGPREQPARTAAAAAAAVVTYPASSPLSSSAPLPPASTDEPQPDDIRELEERLRNIKRT